MMLHTLSPRGALALMLLVWSVVLAKAEYASGSRSSPTGSSQGGLIGKVLRVRKVFQHNNFVSRYPRIHYFLLYSAVRISDRTVCTEYETPVLDEIGDLFSATGKDVEVVLQGRSVTIRTPDGHKLKTHLVKATQCLQSQ
jgi:hypothetical protein